MKKTLVLLLLCLLPPLTLLAQRISRDCRDCPMTSVLADLSRTTTRQRIIFIHNDLEDYLVTQRFDSLTVADAIRACIGHYPISLTVRGDSILLVECMQKTKYKLIGRLVDERNIPVADANITLTTDTTTVARGISNQSGRFVIPTNHPGGTLKPSPEDIQCTLSALAATATISVPLLDHIIIAGESAISIRDSGYIQPDLWVMMQGPKRKLVRDWVDVDLLSERQP